MGRETAPLLVREYAERMGYNISTLAEKSGLSRDTVRLYWKNQVEFVNWTTLTKLAIALNCSNPKDLIANGG